MEECKQAKDAEAIGDLEGRRRGETEQRLELSNED